jgi:hypothetical protein
MLEGSIAAGRTPSFGRGQEYECLASDPDETQRDVL